MRVSFGVTRMAPVLYTTSMPKNTPKVPTTAWLIRAPALMPGTTRLATTNENAPTTKPSNAA